MDQNVFDVFGIPVTDIPENAILQWDWCNWTFIELPQDTLTCDDIVDCVQGELNNLWAAVNNKITCSDLATCPTIIWLQNQIDALPAAILGDVNFYFNNVNGWITTQIDNWGTIEFQGLNGLRYVTDPVSGVINLMLPSGWQQWEVLSWDDDSNGVVWSNFVDCLCEQIQNCPSITALENMYTILQNQINYLLWLDPSEQPVITCSDVANCIWLWATDVDNALDQYIQNRQNWIDLVADVDTNAANIATNTADIATNTSNIWNIQTDITDINNELATILIRECADVMACQWIIDMWTNIATIDVRVNDNEWEISSIWTLLNTVNNTVNNLEPRVNWLETDVADINNELMTFEIRTCADVMACPNIIALVNNVANLDGRVTAIENCCEWLDIYEWSTLISEDVNNMIFNEDHFNLVESSGWVVEISLVNNWLLSVFQDDIEEHDTIRMNFNSCLVASRDAENNWIDVDFTPSMSYDRKTMELELCGETVELNHSLYIHKYIGMAYAKPDIDFLYDWLIVLDETPEIRLVNIPLTAESVKLIWRNVYVYNKANTWPATITANSWVTIVNNPWTIAVWQTMHFIIKNIWTSTIYLYVW